MFGPSEMRVGEGPLTLGIGRVSPQRRWARLWRRLSRVAFRRGRLRNRWRRPRRGPLSLRTCWSENGASPPIARKRTRPAPRPPAREQCGKPYVISKGPTGGVMMYQADQSKPQELVVKAGDGKTFIGPAERSGREANSIGRWSPSTPTCWLHNGSIPRWCPVTGRWSSCGVRRSSRLTRSEEATNLTCHGDEAVEGGFDAKNLEFRVGGVGDLRGDAGRANLLAANTPTVIDAPPPPTK